MNERTHEWGYQPPALTEVGEFSEDTLGLGFDLTDFVIGWDYE